MIISIITATYNSGKTISDTLDSVLKQNFQDYELIIKDGGSNDNTLAICKTYEPKFHGKMRIISTPDNGIYDAMNQGIHAATGDVVGILNSDDLYEDDHVLEDIVNAFIIHDCDCVFGNLNFVKADDTACIVRTWRGSEYRRGAFLKGWHPAHPTFYARRRAFERLGVFDTSFDVSADFELMLRFIEKNQLSAIYVNRNFVRMRLGGESTGSISKIIQGNKNVLRAFQNNGLKPAPFYLLRRLFPKVVDAIKTRLQILF